MTDHSTAHPIYESLWRRPVPCLLGGVLLATFSLNAQALQPFITEDDMFSSLPTVKSATRLQQTLQQSPVAMTLIDRELIRASGAVNLADVFRLVPGFQTYHIHANLFGVVSHGQGQYHPGRLEVMVDGRSVHLTLLSTVDWAALGITLDDIDYIEVVRGSNIQTQGSNAFLGAINIVTRDPLQDQGSRISLTRGSGSLKTQGYHLRHSGHWGPLNVRLSANYHSNNGTGRGHDDGDSSNPEMRIEDQGEISQFNLRTTYTPTLTDSFDLQLGISDGQTGTELISVDNDYVDRDVSSHYQNLTWQHSLNQDMDLKVQAYHNYLRYSGDALYPISVGSFPTFQADLAFDKGTSERYDLDVELTHSLDPYNRFAWEAGVRYDRLESDSLLYEDGSISDWQWRLSGNWEHRLNRNWLLNLGAMLEHSGTIDHQLSPRLALNYQLDSQQSLRASVTRAYRAPSLLEANMDVQLHFPEDPAYGGLSGALLNLLHQPQDLRPEKLTAYEIGYLWQAPDGMSQFDARLFIEDIERGIDQAYSYYDDLMDDQVREYRNTSDWRSRGLELQWRLETEHHHWLHAAYAFTDVEGEKRTGSSSTSLDNSTPSHTLALLAGTRLPWDVSGSLGFYRLTQTQWLGGDKTPSYNRVDIRLAKSFQAARSEAEVELVAQNLFSEYQEFDLKNDFGTRVFLRLSLDFQ